MSKCQRALVSVYDKDGVVELAQALAEMKIDILSTGGTARLLRKNKVPLREVSEVTEFPEMLSGRVKTLHPFIHGGILARRDDPEHMKQLEGHGIGPIDLVVVNLYPFAQTAERAEATPAELVEEIDIGGPTMIRAAAKNFTDVGVVVSPDDYPKVVEELRASGALSLATRAKLARKAFAVTSGYDAVITRTLEELQAAEGGLERAIPTGFPQSLFLGGHKALDLRYGENPHQRAAFYRTTVYADQAPGLGGARQYQGKDLSYNNLLDLDAAWGLAREFWQPFGGNPHGDPVAVIIKHTNPCGTAVAATQKEAYEKALACDPVSAFGSVLGFNQPVTADTAEAVSKLFVEAIAAPGYDDAALEILDKKKNLRVLEMPVEEDTGWRVRSVTGGLLVQDRDVAKLDPAKLQPVTQRAPTEEQLEQLLFAWVVCKHVKSNAIVYARDGQTVGVGAGQMSRVDSVKLAAQKARELGHGKKLTGSVLASDAFFPFPDGVEEAAKAGVTAVIQPGGSKRDNEVIEAADRLGLAMAFTGVRHFRH